VYVAQAEDLMLVTFPGELAASESEIQCKANLLV